jgi:YVTN family beta-propeller protein
VSVISVATGTVLGSITVGSNPYGVAVTPDGTKAYVTNYGSDTVSVIDVATGTVLGSITVGIAPAEVAVTPDGTKAYVTNNGSGTVSVIAIVAVGAGLPPGATVGSPYRFVVPAVNATSFAVTAGALPAGITLDPATGVLTGTPTTAGTASFTITATDASGLTASRAYTLTVRLVLAETGLNVSPLVPLGALAAMLLGAMLVVIRRPRHNH